MSSTPTMSDYFPPEQQAYYLLHQALFRLYIDKEAIADIYLKMFYDHCAAYELNVDSMVRSYGHQLFNTELVLIEREGGYIINLKTQKHSRVLLDYNEGEEEE